MKPGELIQLYREEIVKHWLDKGHRALVATRISDVLDGGRPTGLTPRVDLEHCLWMLDQMEVMLRTMAVACPQTFADDSKYNRWVGFVQGVMYVHGVCDLDQMRDHVRA
jgi:hypothetical protein